MSSAGDNVSAISRPYDMRWGSPKMVRKEFGLNAVALKRAWATGKVRARQGNWTDDDHRTQTIFSFEDIQRYIESGMHVVSAEYVARWWHEIGDRVKTERGADVKAKEGRKLYQDNGKTETGRRLYHDN